MYPSFIHKGSVFVVRILEDLAIEGWSPGYRAGNDKRALHFIGSLGKRDTGYKGLV